MATNMETFKTGLGLDPQSADPSNPKQGDLQYSDGTVRAAGVWQYDGAAWQQVGAAVSDKSVYAQFDAENQDVSDFTNVAVSGTSPIAGDQSYTISTYPADFGAVTINERNKNKINTVSCHYSLTSGSADLVVKDNAANELARLEIDSTVTEEAIVSFYVADTVTSVTLSIEDNTTATGLKVDDIIFTDDPFVNKNLVQTQGTIFDKLASTMTSSSAGTYRWGTFTSETGSGCYSYNDTNGLFTALKPCSVNLSVATRSSSSSNVLTIDKNGSRIMQARMAINDYASESVNLDLVTGDTFEVVGDTALQSTQKQFLTINAFTETENVVHHKAGTENTFSAAIDNNGTASVTSFDVDFIDSVNRVSVGIVDITFKTGFFAVNPTIQATVNETTVRAGYINLTTTGVRIHTRNSTGAEALLDFPFSLTARNQGTDYKQPNAFAVTPTSQVAYVKEIQSSGISSSTSLSAGSFVTNTLNTVSGDSNIVKLAANVMTLNAGTYIISAIIPNNVNGGVGVITDWQSRLRNTTAGTTAATSNGCRWRGSGSTAGSVNSSLLYLEETIVLTDVTDFEIQTFVDSVAASPLTGIDSNSGESETHTQVRIEKIK